MTDPRSNKVPSPQDMQRRTQTDWRAIAKAAIIIFVAAVLIGLAVRAVRGATTPDEWLRLAVELEKQERCLYGPDRAFLREMINIMTLDDFENPTRAQARWLRALKRECKL